MTLQNFGLFEVAKPMHGNVLGRERKKKGKRRGGTMFLICTRPRATQKPRHRTFTSNQQVTELTTGISRSPQDRAVLSTVTLERRQ